MLWGVRCDIGLASCGYLGSRPFSYCPRFSQPTPSSASSRTIRTSTALFLAWVRCSKRSVKRSAMASPSRLMCCYCRSKMARPATPRRSSTFSTGSMALERMIMEIDSLARRMPPIARSIIYNTHTIQPLALADEVLIGSTSTQPRQAIRYRLQPVGYDNTAQFYVFNSHYKASDDSASEAKRLVEANAIRASADALPDGSHIIYAGDHNFYREQRRSVCASDLVGQRASDRSDQSRRQLAQQFRFFRCAHASPLQLRLPLGIYSRGPRRSIRFSAGDRGVARQRRPELHSRFVPGIR